MKYTRYAIQFLDAITNYTSEGPVRGNVWHCVGSPADPTDFNNAYLMSKKALKTAIKNNCRSYVVGSENKIPYRIVEVTVEIPD